MNSPAFRLNPRVLAEVVWRDLLSELDLCISDVNRRLSQLWTACDATRPKMAYDTGSISPSTGLLHYALARRFAPKTVFEVGTFIGRSATAMALGIDDAGRGAGVIHTCDASNDFHVPYAGATRIAGFARMTSTQALTQLAAKPEAVELFHFDGRLVDADLALVQKIARPDAIYAIDDFEGTEKGVANVFMLRAQPWMRGHALVYPPERGLLAERGLISVATLALLVPTALFGITNQ